jgi:hypothetical protein
MSPVITNSPLSNLFDSLIQLFQVLFNLVISLGGVILPWLPLIAWVAFWLLAVDWSKLRGQMVRGGFLAVVLIGLMMILVWGIVAPPADGSHQMLGLKLSNYVGKTVYVTMLLSIMFLCGSVQLSGSVDRLLNFPEDAPEPHAHGH